MMTTRLLAVVSLAGLFTVAPAMLAPIAIAVGPTALVAFAAGCLALAVVV